MATAATSLLGLALPVTGELSGTWGDTVNVSITALLDTAVAGTTTLSSDADVTLTTTTLAANQARQAIILWTAGGTVTRTITVPAQSKAYIVINKTSSSQSIKIVGVGPTTGVTIVAGTAAFVVWNGVDFVTASVTSTTGILPVANGGTGLSSGTSGGVLAYTATGTLASSAALAASALVIGGGAGVAPSTTTTGTGVLTFLGTPSSANLAAAVTDETGSGALVFATSPTFTTSVVGGATMAVFNTTSTTVNAFGAATTLNVGAATGTLTVANTTLAAKAITASTTLTVTGITTLNDDLIVNAAGGVATFNSTNSNGNKITLQDASVTVGSVGATGTGAYLGDSAGTPRVSTTTSGAQVAGTLSVTGNTTISGGQIIQNAATNNYYYYTDSLHINKNGGGGGDIDLSSGLVAVTGALSATGAITGTNVNGATFGDANVATPVRISSLSNAVANGAISFNGVYTVAGQQGLWGGGGGTQLILGVPTGHTAGVRVNNSEITTVSSTGLTVTGTLSATQDITAGNSSGNFNVIVGNASANYSSGVTLKGSSTNTNWEIGQNRLVSSALTFAPSTVGGGSTFTTSAMTLSSTALALGVGISLTGGTSGTGFSFSGTAPATSLTLNSSGNLGVGTSSPSVKLETSTARTATVTSALFALTGTGAVNDFNKITLKVQNTLGGGTGGAGIGAVLEASASNKTGLSFYYDSGSGAQTDGMRLDSSGNLLVGATSALVSAAGRGNITINGTSSSVLAFGVSAANTAYIYSDGTNLNINNVPNGYMTFDTNGFERMRIAASGNLGLGRTPVAYSSFRVLDVAGSAGAIQKWIHTGSTVELQAYASSTLTAVGSATNHPLILTTNDSERARISSDGTFRVKGAGTAGSTDAFQVSGTAPASAASLDSSGNLLVGTTTLPASNRTKGFSAQSNSSGGIQIYQTSSNSDWAITATSGSIVNLYSDNGSALVLAGQITVNGNITTYGSISDYRLKENVQPMTGALANVLSLKPVTFAFKDGGQVSQGFIAHELQSVIPDCVTGTKDAVDADGKPQYQGIDTSFLVATLTAAIQEQQALITQLTARITALETA